MTQAERTALSDKRMFEAALALIGERGVEKTTLREIGERAGYSRGLANIRFGSREFFIDELVNSIHAAWQVKAGAAVGNLRGLEALHAGFDVMIELVSGDLDYVRSMYLLYYETIGSNSRVRHRLSRHHDSYRHTIARWIREGIQDGKIRADVNCYATAVEFLAFYYGVIYLWLTCPENIDIKFVFREYRVRLMTRLTAELPAIDR
jgi:AcrR family transcriptional regulator